MKFTEFTLVPGDAGFESFAPGDEVPDWAVDRVGEHVTDGGKSEPKKAKKEEPESVKDEPEEADPEDEPDFTKPATKGKGKTGAKG